METALHASLLAAFLDPSLSLSEVAGRHELSLPELIAWSTLPEVEAELDALEALAHRRIRALAASHAPAAVETLATLLTAPTPEVARRAASALLRLLGKGPLPQIPTHLGQATNTAASPMQGNPPLAPITPDAPTFPIFTPAPSSSVLNTPPRANPPFSPAPPSSKPPLHTAHALSKPSPTLHLSTPR